MVRSSSLILLLAASLLPGCATNAIDPVEVAAVNGEPMPDPAVAISMIEESIKSKLKDPDSAQFQWPNGFVQGWYQRPFGKRYYGWITCGTVNARNGFGGYAGRVAAVGVIRSGVVVESNMDEASDRYGSFVAEACRKMTVPAG